VIVVLSGLTQAEARIREFELRRHLPEAVVVRTAQPGLSEARNAALREVAPDEIVAYLDDDAVVGESWGSAMSMQWAQAHDDVAAVGGPIRPWFLSPRPRWLSDFQLAGLSIVDHGPAVRDLAEGAGALYGANLSVRATLACAVGGFDARRGPQGKRVGFGDDIEMQARLRRAGGRIIYDPRAWVYHRIGPERLTRLSLLRRRLATGIEYSRDQLEPSPLIVSQLARGLLRALAEAGRGRSAASMDSLAYASQCLGEILGERARLLLGHQP
jgi:hypothetical protein